MRRRKHTLKHGGNWQRISLAEIDLPSQSDDRELLAPDDALEQLKITQPRKADLVKLRYFGGLTISEAAKSLGISKSTADSDWAYAKAWLRSAMQ